MIDDFEQIITFITELEKLKAVERRIKVVNQSRYENSAEHSWQVAMLAMSLLPYAKTELDGGKVIKMLLLHDIVEIDTGDKFAYDANHLDTVNETLAAERIFSLLPEAVGKPLLALWMEFEYSSSPEALFAKGVDRVIPVMQNLQNNGGSWKEHGITAEQILSKNAGVENINSQLWSMIKGKVKALQAKGIIA